MITVTIQTDTPEQALEALRTLSHGHAVQTQTVAVTLPETGKKAKPAAKVAEAAPAPADVAPAAPAAEVLTIQHISGKVADLLAKFERAKVVEFLASFGVKKGSEVPEARWKEFLTKADALK